RLAEEVVEGGLVAMGEGAITGVDRIFALHCDPRFEVGQIGLRTGPITGACDKIRVKVSGLGGHTARPHLTTDLVYALGKIVTELPAALSRRVDPRSSLSPVWGGGRAGRAHKALPEEGHAAGTVRCLAEAAWRGAPGARAGRPSRPAPGHVRRGRAGHRGGSAADGGDRARGAAGRGGGLVRAPARRGRRLRAAAPA